MSYVLLVLLFGATIAIVPESPSELDRVIERLQTSAKQLSLVAFTEAPEAASYLNHDLTKNSPHKLNLTKEITKIIHEWSPRLLALDPACPYYFSKFNNISSAADDLNLFSYLKALELNQTLAYPFVNILPQSYRNGLPLLSIFHCDELVDPITDPFFHNIELIVGPGKSELSLERQSKLFSQLYCSLYGWPSFVLIDQTKQPTTTYDSQTLLSQGSLADVDFYQTTLAPGSCLFVPPDWVSGAQLNNSIAMVFTLNKIEREATDDAQPLSCTTTDQSTLDTIQFTVPDTFNMSDIGLIVYFYQYLNPPMFDEQYTSKTFFEYVREDKNVSQLIMKWTPELIDLIEKTLFQQLDRNGDGIFSANDYFNIKQSNFKQLQSSIHRILEQIRQAVLEQYNELKASLTKMTEQLASAGIDGKTKRDLEAILGNLPEQVKDHLKENNVNAKELLEKMNRKKPTTKERVREDDADILFEKTTDETITSVNDLDQEEEITAEPNIDDDQSYRTDL